MWLPRVALTSPPDYPFVTGLCVAEIANLPSHSRSTGIFLVYKFDRVIYIPAIFFRLLNRFRG